MTYVKLNRNALRLRKRKVGDFFHFIVWATLGNALGGVFFVALLKYSHVIRGGSEPEDVDIEDSDASKEQKRRDAKQRAEE